MGTTARISTAPCLGVRSSPSVLRFHALLVTTARLVFASRVRLAGMALALACPRLRVLDRVQLDGAYRWAWCAAASCCWCCKQDVHVCMCVKCVMCVAVARWLCACVNRISCTDRWWEQVWRHNRTHQRRLRRPLPSWALLPARIRGTDAQGLPSGPVLVRRRN